MPYTYNPLQSQLLRRIVRGKPARWAYHDPRPCLLPPDWSGGYTSIFAVQQEEDWAARSGRRCGRWRHDVALIYDADASWRLPARAGRQTWN